MSGNATVECSGPVVEVEFSLQDPSYPFVAATKDGPFAFELAEMVPRGPGRYAEFFRITGGDPGEIIDFDGAHEPLDISLLREYEDGGLFEFLVSGGCPAATLAELGALPRAVHATDGEGRIVAEIPPQHEPTSIVASFLDETPAATLVSKQQTESFSVLFGESPLRQALQAHLTDRQREVLEAAFEAGYYEWPRECTGEEVATSLGISSATFSEHIHAAERNLLAPAFDRQ